jgi:hypothetical protein
MAFCAAFLIKKLGLEAYAFVLAITHHHDILGHLLNSDLMRIPAFSEFFQKWHGMCSELANKRGWDFGPFFDRTERTKQSAIIDGETLLRKIAYCMTQYTKAGFVKSDYEMRDVGVPILMPDNLFEPLVFERNSLIDEIDPTGTRFGEFDREKGQRMELLLAVPRPFKHLSREQYYEILSRAVEEREALLAEERGSKRLRGIKAARRPRLGDGPRNFRRTGYTVSVRLGLKRNRKVRRQRGQRHKPRDPYRGVTCADPVLLAAFHEDQSEFRRQHRDSVERVRNGERDVAFPAGSYGRRVQLDAPCLPAKPGPWAELPTWQPPP